MALPLKDFRLGITESIDIWLDAVAVANTADKAAGCFKNGFESHRIMVSAP